MKTLIALVLLFLISCTPKPESKITAVLQKEFNKEQGMDEYSKSLDTLYGKDCSKFETSMMAFFNDRINFRFTDIKTEGDKATAVVDLTLPNRKDVEGLVGITTFMSQKILKDMTLDELMNKIGKDTKAKFTSSRDIKDETIKETVELARNGTDEWTLDPSSKKKVSDAIKGKK